MKKFQLRNLHNTKTTRLKNLLPGYMYLQTTEACWLTVKQIEAARRILKKTVSDKFSDKLMILIKPSLRLTAKSQGVRMGKGKGGLLPFSVSQIKKGQILFQCLYAQKRIIYFLKAAKKLPLKVRILIP